MGSAKSMEEFDYIIVGAGSAGCVLANRISANSGNSVLLVEAGGSDRNIFVQMPTALSYPMAMDRFNWGYHSDPEPGLDGRRISCPRGKGLGVFLYKWHGLCARSTLTTLKSGKR